MMFNFFKKEVRYAPRSSEWKEVRKLHLKRESECIACGKDSIKDLEVHHIVPVHINKTLELEPSNLVTLCTRCHLVFGHLSDYRSWNRNVINDSLAYYDKVQDRPYKK